MSDDIFSCSCPKCGSDLNIPSEFCGKDVECPECSFSFTVDSPNVETDSSMDASDHIDMSDSATVIDTENLEVLTDMSNAATKVDPQPNPPENESVDMNFAETKPDAASDLVDMSEGDTHMDLPIGAITDDEFDEDELVDLSEGDTEPPYMQTSSAVIDLTETGTIEPQNDMHCSTVKIQRKNIGMVPDCNDKEIKFAPIESTQSLDLNRDDIRKALTSKKKWWQFWK